MSKNVGLSPYLMTEAEMKKIFVIIDHGKKVNLSPFFTRPAYAYTSIEIGKNKIKE